MNKIYQSKVNFNLMTGELKGDSVLETKRVLGDLHGIFEDNHAFDNMNKDTVVYKVQCHMREQEGKKGGLFFGTSYLYPGSVGNEYFMTKGHFHSTVDTTEYYWCIGGEGTLILMDEMRNCWAEKMVQGSLHYIPGKVAHRIANTGNDVLVVGACWPSDAGHDYDTIKKSGFSARLKNVNGVPRLIPVE
jgi:glucose-6-phosphate isomerase